MESVSSFVDEYEKVICLCSFGCKQIGNGVRSFTLAGNCKTESIQNDDEPRFTIVTSTVLTVPMLMMPKSIVLIVGATCVMRSPRRGISMLGRCESLVVIVSVASTNPSLTDAG